MKQAYVPAAGVIAYRDVEKPKITPGSVLIRTARIGICGSDIHAFHGKHPLVSFPLVQGHEFSGYVEETGQGVSGYSKGDLVTVQPAIGCGRCKKCSEGQFARCDDLKFIGGSLPGAASEFFLIDARQVVKLPQGISADDAAMIEPLAVAVHAVGKPARIEGARVLVAGGGTIGNLVAQASRAMGAGKIVLIETRPFRAGLARSLGIDAFEPRSVESIGNEMDALFEGKKANIAFECVGAEGPLNACIESVERGGYVIILGVYEQPVRAGFLTVQDRELQLLGSLMYTWDDYHTAVRLLAEKRIDVKTLPSHHFPFEKWGEAYALLKEKPHETMKVIIDVNG